MAKEKYVIKQYPDTVEGCKEFVAYESVFVVTPDTKFEADPFVEGVWRVSNLSAKTNKEKHTIVLYMAGYNDPWKRRRPDNDFEEGYR